MKRDKILFILSCFLMFSLALAAVLVFSWLFTSPTEPQARYAAPQPKKVCVVAEKPQQSVLVPHSDVVRIAQTLWGECRGVPSDTRKAAVAWCILNRVDDPRWPSTVKEVVVKSQFNGYSPNNPVTEELYDLSVDVYTRWMKEKQGEQDIGRVLPAEYTFFIGDSKENHFSTEYLSNEYWGWTLESPYES